ncbi:MAG: hypothetical protein JWO69_262 [Thermoleophilia bacterium]|nr:hypothetical protein [Thermoleophilia bacterium]
MLHALNARVNGYEHALTSSVARPPKTDLLATKPGNTYDDLSAGVSMRIDSATAARINAMHEAAGSDYRVQAGIHIGSGSNVTVEPLPEWRDDTVAQFNSRGPTSAASAAPGDLQGTHVAGTVVEPQWRGTSTSQPEPAYHWFDAVDGSPTPHDSGDMGGTHRIGTTTGEAAPALNPARVISIDDARASGLLGSLKGSQWLEPTPKYV